MIRRARRPAFWLPIGLLAFASSPGVAAPEPAGVAAPEPAGVAAPERAGFTGDLSIGGSLTTRTVTSSSLGSNGTSTDETSTELEPGFAPPWASAWAGTSRRGSRSCSVWPGPPAFAAAHQYLQLYTGPMVEYWPRDRWFLAGGIGLGTFTPNPLTGSSVVISREGLALDGGGGAGGRQQTRPDPVARADPGLLQEPGAGRGRAGGRLEVVLRPQNFREMPAMP